MIEQASAIPLRNSKSGLEVCLITSIKSGKWGFPKGIIDPGYTAEETALKEAEEEAGLFGELLGEPLGSYQYHKWDTTLEVSMYVMRVLRMAEMWEEKSLREREWFTPDQALALLEKRRLRDFLNQAIECWTAM